MSTKKIYMVLDTETATLPFVDGLGLSTEQKKRVAISKPLIYDIGWVLCDRNGNISAKKQFLIAETFSVPSVFNTAYYRDKRPIYLEKIRNSEITVMPWAVVLNELLSDLNMVEAVAAYNAMFDFKKAIPFTDLYISQLYSPNYYQWEKMQMVSAAQIAKGAKPSTHGKFDPENFLFHGLSIPIIDIWGVACSSLINTQKYKIMCIENGMLTDSGEFFKTSAEATFRYITQNIEFEEAHTALNDAEIETEILRRAFKRGKVNRGIEYFPFNNLGTTDEFLSSDYRGKKLSHFDTVANALENRMNKDCRSSSYQTKIEGKLCKVQVLRDEFRRKRK